MSTVRHRKVRRDEIIASFLKWEVPMFLGKSRSSLCLLVLALAVPSLSLAHLVHAREATDQAYAVRLFRPAKVGEKYDIFSSASQQTHMEVLGSRTKMDLSVVDELEGAFEVLAVDSKGDITKIACALKKLTRKEGDGDAVEVLPAGSVVIADFTPDPAHPPSGDANFTLKEGQLTPAQVGVVGLMLSNTHPPECPTSDEISSVTTPQKLGDSWRIDSTKLAEYYATTSVKVGSQDLHGTVTLEGVSKLEGTDCLELKLDMSAENLRLPPRDKLRSDGIKMKMTRSIMIPVDLHSQSYSEAADLDSVFIAQIDAPEGAPIRARFSTRTHFRSKVSRSATK